MVPFRPLFVLVLLALPAPLHAQEPPITIEHRSMELIGPEHELQRYTPRVRLTLTIRNNTTEMIAGWGATAVFVDASGNELFRTRLTHGKADIPAGMSGDAVYEWEDNEFFHDQPFDKLVGRRADEITIRLEEIGIDRRP